MLEKCLQRVKINVALLCPGYLNLKLNCDYVVLK